MSDLQKTLDWNAKIMAEFRETGGTAGGFFEDKTLLILHTTGAKSGKHRENPLVTIEDDGKLIIVASKGGADTHPAWYYNLVANPDVEVEFGTERFSTKAVVTEEPERTELYEKMEAEYAFFTEYKQKAARVIPVITVDLPS